jgi:hypothetical protein
MYDNQYFTTALLQVSDQCEQGFGLVKNVADSKFIFKNDQVHTLCDMIWYDIW